MTQVGVCQLAENFCKIVRGVQLVAQKPTAKNRWYSLKNLPQIQKIPLTQPHSKPSNIRHRPRSMKRKANLVLIQLRKRKRMVRRAWNRLKRRRVWTKMAKMLTSLIVREQQISLILSRERVIFRDEISLWMWEATRTRFLTLSNRPQIYKI